MVLHSLFLSCRYQAHINVEYCGSVKVIKYIHKYVYKSANQTTVALNTKTDKVTWHSLKRYIGPTERIWRLFNFLMHEEFPLVKKLAVHLPEEQIVYFHPDLTPAKVQEQIKEARSTLMAFFEYNAEHTDGRQWLYQEFLTYYTYCKKIQQ